MGMTYRRGRVWWIKYYRAGRPYFESSRSTKQSVARDLLKAREGDIARGVPVSPRAGRILFDEIVQDVVVDYTVNGRRSLDKLVHRVDKHLLPYFGGRRVASITTPDLRRFVAARQAAGAANAEVNREMAAIRRAFNLAIQAGKLHHKPHFPMLRENNVRIGFFEREQFHAVRAHLPEALRPMITFAYITGWRINSEVLSLQWRQVNFETGRVCLEADMTKNDQAREFPLTGDLRKLLEAQRAVTDLVQRERDEMVPWVFHRAGRRILYFRGAWQTACRRAGVPGRIPHDFRRTAVRNLVRAGVPERVAMTMTGHKSRSVFERYNIVSQGDLNDAARRLDESASRPAARTTSGTAGA